MSSYLVLARKWRPQNFDQLAGQTHVARALRNALASGRMPHAFLFFGVRGVGKTTLARLIAKCLNCQQGVGPDPCGVCEACQAVAAGNHPDVMEIDAASRTKVDQMREVLDTVCYLPTLSPYKVYILDEVHMLTTQSFNALLKTLEEPPPHVKFIFATTEPRKIPATILSRCQRYDLKRLTREEMTQHLEKILRLENIAFEEAALMAVVRAADGSVRDALSLLDQVIAHGDGQLQYEAVAMLLGLVDRQGVVDLLEHVLLGQPTKVLTDLDLFYQGGVEPTTLVNELLDLVHQVARFKVLALSSQDAVPPEDRFAYRLQDLSRRLAMEHVQMAYQVLLRGRQDLRIADFPYQSLEMLVLRVAYMKPLPEVEALFARLGQEGGGLPPVQSAGPSPGSTGQSEVQASPVAHRAWTSWEGLVDWIATRHGKFATRLRAQLSCLAFQPATDNAPLTLSLQMAHEVFGAPDRLQQELGQILTAMGVGQFQITVAQGGGQESRPETLSEVRERERQNFMQGLEKDIRDHPAVRILQERMQAELLRIDPVH